MVDLCDKYYAELNLEQPMMLAPSVREKILQTKMRYS